MPSDSEAFVASLRKAIQARRTFGGHPLWQRIQDGLLAREGLRTFAVQFFLQVREFPRAVSALHAQVPGAFAPFARALERYYGLGREQVAFWNVHEIADRDHSDIGDHIVVRFAHSEEWQAKVQRA